MVDQWPGQVRLGSGVHAGRAGEQVGASWVARRASYRRRFDRGSEGGSSASLAGLLARAYHPRVSRPTLLAILSLPAAAIGYAVTAAILTSVLPRGEGPTDLLLIFVPLLVAGLCMVPFLIPFVDRMAKRDLEAHRAATAAADHAPPDGDVPED